MTRLWYVTHPEVRLDPHVPVERWGLTDVGRRRAAAMCSQPWLDEVERLVSSGETKALELAAVVAARTGLPIEVRERTGEVDRSATGFIPPDEYAAVSDAWFASPSAHDRGWEPAAAVQRRIVAALEDVMTAEQPVLVVGHGGAGTLLWCHLAGESIAATHDQASPGHYFTVDLTTGRPLHRWQPIDTVEA